MSAQAVVQQEINANALLHAKSAPTKVATALSPMSPVWLPGVSAEVRPPDLELSKPPPTVFDRLTIATPECLRGGPQEYRCNTKLACEPSRDRCSKTRGVVENEAIRLGYQHPR